VKRFKRFKRFKEKATTNDRRAPKDAKLCH
jgi:hypothetical protein